MQQDPALREGVPQTYTVCRIYDTDTDRQTPTSLPTNASRLWPAAVSQHINLRFH